MRNADKCPNIPYSATWEMKKWSGICMQIRITTKSPPLLEGHLLPEPTKFGRRPFLRSSVILFTKWQNDHITSALLAEVTTTTAVLIKQSGSTYLQQRPDLLTSNDAVRMIMMRCAAELVLLKQYFQNISVPQWLAIPSRLQVQFVYVCANCGSYSLYFKKWCHYYYCYAPARKEGGNKRCFCPSIRQSVCPSRT